MSEKSNKHHYIILAWLVLFLLAVGIVLPSFNGVPKTIGKTTGEFDMTESLAGLADILLDERQKTVLIALGPSNQRGEWRNNEQWYTMYSALLEAWPVSIAGIPSFTHNQTQNVMVPMWARPDYNTVTGVQNVKRQPGEQSQNLPAEVYGNHMELISTIVSANVADNQMISMEQWLNPAEDYPYKADISKFRSTQHSPELVVIRMAPSAGVNNDSQGPKIRLAWGKSAAQSGEDVTVVEEVFPSWHLPGNNRLTTSAHSYGTMPNDGEIWAPRWELVGGPGHEKAGADKADYLVRYLLRVDGGGLIFWPMGRGNWGYASDLEADNWSSEDAFTDIGWQDSLSAIRSGASRLVVMDHIGLADAVSSQIDPNLAQKITAFHSRLRVNAASAGYKEVIIVHVVDPKIPSASDTRMRTLVRHKRIAYENDAGPKYFINLAQRMNYEDQPSEWLVDGRHNTYLGTVEIMKMLWEVITEDDEKPASNSISNFL